METLKTIMRKDPFWKCLANECDESLGNYDTTGQMIDQDYERFKTKLTQALTRKAPNHSREYCERESNLMQRLDT